MPEEERKDPAPLMFLARLRSGGGSGKSLQLTIPKELVEFLELKAGDYVRAHLDKVEK